MPDLHTRGIIIKQNDYGEGNRMLSIFAEGTGIIKAVGYGAKKAKSSRAASSQFLCYGEFELYGGGEIFTLKNVNVKDAFLPVSEDIIKLSLCAYLADITYFMLGQNNPDDRMLHVFLNALYALSYRDEDIFKVKSVYELKLMAIEGYEPFISGCGVCGANTLAAFDISKGTAVCPACRGRDCIPLSESVYKAMRFILSVEDRKMLSFNGNDVLIERLGEITEKYFLAQADKNFASLDYFKTMCGIIR